MIGSRRHIITARMVAIVFTVATIAVSCKNKIAQTDFIDLESSPTQVVDNMVVVQTKDGLMEMRMESPRMERYEKSNKESYELFPKGFSVFGYNEEGLLETTIIANEAKHTIGSKNEEWAAYGDVVIKNLIKGEKMETDTIFWDQSEKKIYTHCYVKLTAPDGMTQGVGMESDEMARNAYLLSPFDSYGLISNDSTSVSYVDSANFIGPLVRR